MKKFMFILLSMMFCSSVKAVEIKYSDWSSEYPKGIEGIKIQSEKRYLWYKEKEINVEYLSYENIGDKKVDMNDFIYGEYSDYTLNEPVVNIHQEVTSELRTNVLQDNEINFIEFTDINVRNEFKVYEIEVYFDGIKTNYISNFDTINDNNYDNLVDIFGAIKVSFDFDGMYDPHEMKIIITYSYYGIGIGNYKINLGIDTNNKRYTTYYKSITPDLCPNKCTQEILFDTSYVLDNRIMQMFYAYREKLYKTYNIEKIYTDQYYNKYEGYIKDNDTLKEYYRYILNDYIIKDNEGNIIDKDSEYCDKHICLMMYLPYEEKIENAEDISTIKPVEEKNPKTIDNITIYIIIFSISVTTIIVILKKYVEKKRMKNIS